MRRLAATTLLSLLPTLTLAQVSGQPGSPPPNQFQRGSQGGAFTFGTEPNQGFGIPGQAPIIATPLPPPDTQPPASPAEPTAPPGAPRFPDIWLPRQGASIQALDKVNARHASLTLRLGVPVTFQTLTIMLKACVVRPPDQPTDAAAFLSVTDSNPEAPPFNGWVIRSVPAASMLAHPIYDLRINGCLP
jgi:hypothetical protein